MIFQALFGKNNASNKNWPIFSQSINLLSSLYCQVIFLLIIVYININFYLESGRNLNIYVLYFFRGIIFQLSFS